ncbi:claudin-1 precursor [Silurus meridionalis]|nr:claudin-1 precursor [Silurus meridionalis]
MASGGMQLVGFSLAFLGFVGLIISTTMTEWKMSSYAGDNIITAQAVYEGLWQSCVYQSTGQLQCKVFDSLLQLPRMCNSMHSQRYNTIRYIPYEAATDAMRSDSPSLRCLAIRFRFDSTRLEVQAARGFMLSGILLCGIAVMVASVGMKCTKCLEDDIELKNKVAVAGGAVFVIAGICAFVATIWYGDNIRRQFFNPFTPTNAKYEFGKALYIGWGACALTVIGGSLLCCNCGKSSGGTAARYPAARPTQPSQPGYV